MSLPRSAINKNNRLRGILVPSQPLEPIIPNPVNRNWCLPRINLTSRIHNIQPTNIIITNINLGIPAIQLKRPMKRLRRSKISKPLRLHIDSITSAIPRIELGVAQEVEIRSVGECRGDGE